MRGRDGFASLICGLLFWLSLQEAIAAVSRLRGLRITGRLTQVCIAPALLLALRRLRHDGWHGGHSLALTSLPALVGHLTLASWRNRAFDPRLRLRPGIYADRQIARLDIPTATGPVPALYVVPHAATGSAVCVAHGSGCNKTFYAWPIVDTLIQQNLAVLLIDLDGHGESPRPQAFPAIVQNISGSLEWLRIRHERVGVIGVSLGGCIALRAVADTALADALVVLEAPIRLYYTRWHMLREALALMQPAVLRLLRDGSPYHIARAWESPRIRARIGTRDLIEALDVIGSLQRIAAKAPDLPLLLIYGDSDAIVPRVQAEQVRQTMPRRASFCLLSHASHLSLPIDPRTQRLIADWLMHTLTADR